MGNFFDYCWSKQEDKHAEVQLKPLPAQIPKQIEKRINEEDRSRLDTVPAANLIIIKPQKTKEQQSPQKSSTILLPPIYQTQHRNQPFNLTNQPAKLTANQPINQTVNYSPVYPNHNQQLEIRPASDIRYARTQQIKIQNRSVVGSQKPSKQLVEKQNCFKNSQQFQQAQKQGCPIQKLLQISAKCHELQLFTLEKSIYKQALTKLQQVQNKYSPQSIAQIKAHIYTQLANAVIAENKNQTQADQYVKKALQSYDKTVQSATIQQRITLLNNYSVFKRNCGNLPQAKSYLQQTIDLMDIYYVVSDERKYLALINLACLEYETSNKIQGEMILEKVKKECQNSEIIIVAEGNKMFYKNK